MTRPRKTSIFSRRGRTRCKGIGESLTSAIPSALSQRSRRRQFELRGVRDLCRARPPQFHFLVKAKRDANKATHHSFQLARVFVRLDHVARSIVNANHGIMWAAAKRICFMGWPPPGTI